MPYDGDRPQPPQDGDERSVLDGWIAFHRATLLWKCEGLTPEQLGTAAVPPSRLTLLGLVRHMTDVERGWVLPFVGREAPSLYATEEDPDGEFDVTGADAAQDLASFRRETAALDELLRGRDLDELEDGRLLNLRWILTHLVEEYARHNGHADLIREVLDGSTGD